MRVPVRAAILMTVILVSGLACAGAAFSRTLSYLPRSEEIQQLRTSDVYSLHLTAASCAPVTELTNKINRCQQCMSLKSLCPDCCLTDDQDAQQCSAAADPAYGCQSGGTSCTAAAFTSSVCSPVIGCDVSLISNCQAQGLPGCQQRGCMSGAPAVSTGGHCVEDSSITGVWICDRNEPSVPPVAGCTPQPNTAQDCNLIPGPHYTVTTAASCPAGLTGACFTYTPSPSLNACVQACRAYTGAYETYTKNTYCCKKDVCCAQLGCSGSDVGATVHCNSAACDYRVNWPECSGTDTSLCCNDLTSDQCAAWSAELTACGSDLSGGGCKSCYAELDPSFRYEFVAKSNEKLALIWEIEATPSYTPASSPDPGTYFFSMIKVFEEGRAEPVHQSIAHQRTFTASFSIFSSSVVERGVLKAGKKYSVRVYYFLPSVTNYTLESTVTHMQIISFRVRE